MLFDFIHRLRIDSTTQEDLRRHGCRP